MNQRKLVLYIACSLDGYIAKPNDDLSFLNLVNKEGEDYGYNEFISSVDTVIIGRKTYDWVKKNAEAFSHADKETYVITRRTREKEDNTTFYNGDLKMLVEKQKSRNGKTIFCDGGADIVNELLKEKMFDELIISVIPVILGDGIRLFREGIPEQELELFSAKNFDAGLVQLHYKMQKK